MANGLPCPNPACKHVFALTEIRGASKLACPRCARVFRFVVDSSGRTRLVAPPAAVTGNPGHAVNVELVKPPTATPVASPDFISLVPTSVVDRHRRRAPGSKLSVIMGTLVAVLVVAMVVAGYVMFRSPGEEKAEPRPGGTPFRREPDSAERTAARKKVPQPTVFLRGEHCEVEVPVGVWRKFKASDEDEQADLLLRGRRPDATDDASKNATVLVVKLDKALADISGAARMVRDRLEQQRRAQTRDARLVQMSALPLANSDHGEVQELKLEAGGQPRRYIALGVIMVPGAVYGISCECDWDIRQLWQSDFHELVKSFRITDASS